MTTENPFEGRAHGNLVFHARHDRVFYIGRLSPRQRKEWLRDHPERWQTREDALRDLQARAGTDIKAEPPESCSTTLANEVRTSAESEGPLPVPAEDKPLPDRPATNTTPPTIANAEATATAGDEIKDDVASADPLLGDRSRPRESTAPPTPVKESAEKQKPLAGIARSTPKLCPELMLLVLDALAECPFYYYAANKAGIHPKTLAYWIRRSEAGDDGYDIEWEDVTGRFHELCKLAIDEAVQILLDRMLERGFVGYDKVLSYRGRVVYKIDQGLVDLGCQGPDAYLRDENGNPVPETFGKWT